MSQIAPTMPCTTFLRYAIVRVSRVMRTKLLLNFDFSSLWIEEQDYDVIGFDYNAFEGFEIDTLTIKSAPKTLYVLDDAFKDCSITTLKHSSGIVFDGFTFDNTEVIAL